MKSSTRHKIYKRSLEIFLERDDHYGNGLCSAIKIASMELYGKFYFLNDIPIRFYELGLFDQRRLYWWPSNSKKINLARLNALLFMIEMTNPE